MKKIIKSRKGGFTLVELLIVIMIIAILAGMMMLATGGATDSATATRIINDLRSVKGAIILAIADSGASPADYHNGTADPWLLFNEVGKFTDRASFHLSPTDPMSSSNKAVYTPEFTSFEISATGETRAMIGFNLDPNHQNRGLDFTEGVQKKLAQMASKAGLYDENGNIYTNGNKVFMICF